MFGETRSRAAVGGHFLHFWKRQLYLLCPAGQVRERDEAKRMHQKQGRMACASRQHNWTTMRPGRSSRRHHQCSMTAVAASCPTVASPERYDWTRARVPFLLRPLGPPLLTQAAARYRIDSTARRQSVTVYTCLVQTAWEHPVLGISNLAADRLRHRSLGSRHWKNRGPLSLCP